MGEYTVQASVIVRQPAPDVMRWLTSPALLAQWMLGAESVEPLDELGAAPGAMTRVTIFAARNLTSYTGQITELGPVRLARRYQLASRRRAAASTGSGSGEAEYERFVCYDLTPSASGTGVTCTARTVIPGLSRSIKDGHRASTTALRRSLERLATCAEGRSIGMLAKFNDPGKSTGEPL